MNHYRYYCCFTCFKLTRIHFRSCLLDHDVEVVFFVPFSCELTLFGLAVVREARAVAIVGTCDGTL